MPNSPFIYKTFLHLHETDAAQIIFFGRLSEICQCTFEDFFLKNNFSLKKIFNNEIPYVFYVRHYECDFFSKIFFLDEIQIKMSCTKIGNSSFTMNFDFHNRNKEILLANAKITYVCTDKKSKKKINVPKDLINIFSSILIEK